MRLNLVALPAFKCSRSPIYFHECFTEVEQSAQECGKKPTESDFLGIVPVNTHQKKKSATGEMIRSVITINKLKEGLGYR